MPEPIYYNVNIALQELACVKVDINRLYIAMALKYQEEYRCLRAGHTIKVALALVAVGL